MFKKSCATPTCGIIIYTEFNQTKYCPKCSKRRKNTLELIRLTKSRTGKYLQSVKHRYNVKVKKIDSMLMLKVYDLESKKGKSLELMLHAHNDHENAVIMKHVFKAYSYLLKNENQFKEILG